MNSCIVYPYELLKPAVYTPGKNFTMKGGVYRVKPDGDHELLEDSLEVIHGFSCQTTYDDEIRESLPELRLDGESYYGGALVFHYGHFLTQTISRLRGFDPSRHKFLVFSFHRDRDTSDNIVKSMPAFARETFTLLGVSLDCVRVASQHRIFCSSLEVHRADWEIPGDLRSEFTDFVAKEVRKRLHLDPHSGSSRKVFISKSRYHKGLSAGEVQLERLLFMNGFTIIYPEQHSMHENIRLLNDADLVVGMSGSAMHIVLMLPDAPRKIILIHRNQDRSGMGVQRALHSTRYIKTVEVDALANQFGTGTLAMSLLDLTKLVSAIETEIQRPLFHASLLSMDLARQEFADLTAYREILESVPLKDFSPTDEHIQSCRRLCHHRLSPVIYSILAEMLFRLGRRAASLSICFEGMSRLFDPSPLLAIRDRIIGDISG